MVAGRSVVACNGADLPPLCSKPGGTPHARKMGWRRIKVMSEGSDRSGHERMSQEAVMRGSSEEQTARTCLVIPAPRASMLPTTKSSEELRVLGPAEG